MGSTASRITRVIRGFAGGKLIHDGFQGRDTQRGPELEGLCVYIQKNGWRSKP
jgi:hypothetical protein